LVVAQAQQIAGSVVRNPILGRLAQLQIAGVDLGPRIADLGAQVVSWIGSSAFGLIGTATRLALNLTISLFGLFYLLLRPEQTWEAVRPYIPFSAKNAEKLRQRFRDVTTSTIIGTGLTAAVQGLLVGVGFWIVHLPNAVFWGVVTMVFAVLPVVGSGLVWGPGAIALDRKSTRLNSSHLVISYAVFCLKKKKQEQISANAGFRKRSSAPGQVHVPERGRAIR